MKNIWIMLLMVCSACAFTACSDNDDERCSDRNPAGNLHRR